MSHATVGAPSACGRAARAAREPEAAAGVECRGRGPGSARGASVTPPGRGTRAACSSRREPGAAVGRDADVDRLCDVVGEGERRDRPGGVDVPDDRSARDEPDPAGRRRRRARRGPDREHDLRSRARGRATQQPVAAGVRRATAPRRPRARWATNFGSRLTRGHGLGGHGHRAGRRDLRERSSVERSGRPQRARPGAVAMTLLEDRRTRGQRGDGRDACRLAGAEDVRRRPRTMPLHQARGPRRSSIVFDRRGPEATVGACGRPTALRRPSRADLAPTRRRRGAATSSSISDPKLDARDLGWHDAGAAATPNATSVTQQRPDVHGRHGEPFAAIWIGLPSRSVHVDVHAEARVAAGRERRARSCAARARRDADSGPCRRAPVTVVRPAPAEPRSDRTASRVDRGRLAHRRSSSRVRGAARRRCTGPRRSAPTRIRPASAACRRRPRRRSARRRSCTQPRRAREPEAAARGRTRAA